MSVRVTVREQQEPIVVHDDLQLQAVLAAAEKEASSLQKLNIVSIEAENGNTLGIVVGGPESSLSFSYGHLNPPYYASKGPGQGVEPVLTCFLALEHHTEFPRGSVIPKQQALRAATEFVASPERPKSVEWVEV